MDEPIDLEEFLRRHSDNANSCQDLNVLQFASDNEKSVVSLKGQSEYIVGSLFSAMKYRPEIRRMVFAAVESFEEDRDGGKQLTEEERLDKELDAYLLNKKVSNYLSEKGFDCTYAPVVDGLSIFWDEPKKAVISIFKGVNGDKFESVTGELYDNCVRMNSPYLHLSIINNDR